MEVGVGTGRFSTPFAVAVGLDPSRAMASIAKKKGVEVVCGVGENLPFAAETFDFVLLVTTICFVDDPRTTLREARRVLKDHGSVIVGLVDKNSTLGRFYESRKEASVFYQAATFYSVNQVRDWLTELSFADLSAYQTIFRPLDTVERMEPIREGFGQGGFVALRATKIAIEPAHSQLDASLTKSSTHISLHESSWTRMWFSPSVRRLRV